MLKVIVWELRRALAQVIAPDEFPPDTRPGVKVYVAQRDVARAQAAIAKRQAGVLRGFR